MDMLSRPQSIGDPEIEAMEQWRHSEEGKRILAALDAASPKFVAEYQGRPIITGTGGNLEGSTKYADAFYDPKYYAGVDPYKHDDTPQVHGVSTFFVYEKIDNVWGLLP